MCDSVSDVVSSGLEACVRSGDVREMFQSSGGENRVCVQRYRSAQPQLHVHDHTRL